MALKRLAIAATVVLSVVVAVGSAAGSGTYRGGYYTGAGSYRYIGGDRDVNLLTLGQDILSGEFYTPPAMDFTGANVYYFDPNALDGTGDGSIDNPFQGFGTEYTSGAIFQRYQYNGNHVDSGYTIGAGDVCVLRDGNHGYVDINYSYWGWGGDWLAVVGMPGEVATVDSLDLAGGSMWYFKNIHNTKTLRDDWEGSVGTGNYTRAGFDGVPSYFKVSDGANGDVNYTQHIVFQDCTAASADYATAAAWNESEWRAGAANAFRAVPVSTGRTSKIHFQNCRASAVNYGFKLAEFDSSNVFNCATDLIIGDGIQLGSCDYPHIRGVTMGNFKKANDNHLDFIQGYWQDAAITGGLIENNYFHNYALADTSLLAAMNGILFSGGLPTGVDIINNVIVTANWGGIKLVTATDCEISNNTLVGLWSTSTRRELGDSLPVESAYESDGVPVIHFSGTTTNCRVFNNVYGDSIANDFHKTGVTATNNARYGWDYTDAGFVDYELQTSGIVPPTWNLALASDSENVNAGYTTATVADDYAGKSRPQSIAYDIGAYEYFIGGSTTAPAASASAMVLASDTLSVTATSDQCASAIFAYRVAGGAWVNLDVTAEGTSHGVSDIETGGEHGQQVDTRVMFYHCTDAFATSGWNTIDSAVIAIAGESTPPDTVSTATALSQANLTLDAEADMCSNAVFRYRVAGGAWQTQTETDNGYIHQVANIATGATDGQLVESQVQLTDCDDATAFSAWIDMQDRTASIAAETSRTFAIPDSSVFDDLTDFVIPVVITHNDLRDGDAGGNVARGTGGDIHFTSDSAGTNELHFELAAYDSVTGAVEAHVMKHTLWDGGDSIYMWYGDSDRTSTANADSVWFDYSFVAHFNDSTTCYVQSDQDAYMSNRGNAGTIGTGLLGSALDFDEDGGIRVMDARPEWDWQSSQVFVQITYQVLYSVNTLNTNNVIMGHAAPSNAGGWELTMRDPIDSDVFFFTFNNAKWTKTYSDDVATGGAWHMAVAMIDPATGTYGTTGSWIDGATIHYEAANNNSIPTTLNDWAAIGGDPRELDQYYNDGAFDEVRVLTGYVPDNARIRTEWSAWRWPTAFCADQGEN